MYSYSYSYEGVEQGLTMFLLPMVTIFLLLQITLIYHNIEIPLVCLSIHFLLPVFSFNWALGKTEFRREKDSKLENAQRWVQIGNEGTAVILTFFWIQMKQKEKSTSRVPSHRQPRF